MSNDDDQLTPIAYGKRELIQSFHSGRMTSVEIAPTNVYETDNTINAHEKVIDIVTRLVSTGEARKSISVTYDIDSMRREVKRIHVRHITVKEQIPVNKR